MTPSDISHARTAFIRSTASPEVASTSTMIWQESLTAWLHSAAAKRGDKSPRFKPKQQAPSYINSRTGYGIASNVDAARSRRGRPAVDMRPQDYSLVGDSPPWMRCNTVAAQIRDEAALWPDSKEIKSLKSLAVPCWN
ncbi:hypothetical protein [Bradyrhizobium sp. 2TAF24]|uniref:hypothetical protein n=1 Tax=Bradyrhizobium sp. 2TAF24 TaxID=3233011 RepID=UPI003F934F61